ncbi:MAG: hypothetical protein NVS9B14_07120 [Candidatus Acidiferrum sp.]
MKHPPYHTRPNKAADRLTLIDAIRLAVKTEELGEYTYYSMGGPTLEDFRLIYEFYPEIRMVCIERDQETYKRQRFHLPCRSRRLRLENTTFQSFLAQYEAKDEKSIFWMDYTDLKLAHFDDFMELLGKVGTNSIIKITLRCHPRDYKGPEQAEEFRKRFEAVLPNASDRPPAQFDKFAVLLQKMVQIASQKALPSAMPSMFLPLSSFYYNDGVGIFTLTGVVCQRTREPMFRKALKKWPFANTNWNEPREIDVPSLSTRERLHLQRHLPRGGNAGRTLQRALGYLIDDSSEQTESQLQQYADFHRYFPHFVKAIP